MQYFGNPEWLAAFGTIVIGIGTLLWGHLRKRPQDKGIKPSIHQEAVRPETAAEIKSAESLKRIADAMEKLERQMLVFLAQQPRK